MSRRILAAIAAMSWLAGCVSILGVDAEEHDDVSAIICACSNAGRDLCEAFVRSALDSSPGAEEEVLDCAASGAGCAELDTCLFEAGVCSGPRERCSVENEENRVNVRCCDGLVCERARCVEAVSCATLRAPCAEGGCCEGLSCDDGACCVADTAPCSANAECCSGLTCDGAVCQPCGDGGVLCDVDAVESTCCDGFDCLAGVCQRVL